MADNIPQDLLLIRDLVVEEKLPSLRPGQLPQSSVDIDSIDSSGSDTDIASEDEIAADLVNSEEDCKSSLPSDSSSDSDSELDPSEEIKSAANHKLLDQNIDDDEDSGPAVVNVSYLPTKNEIVSNDVLVPEIEEVGPEEELEKVGEIFNIIDNVVIVRGLESGNVGRASARALDSDTLLVYDDRKTMGYIYETFGPTSQPLYQIKYNQQFPLDLERARISREVFHLPQRSRFVFLSQISRLKGSDASNVHDEEPAEDEVEFSDDEAEAAHKSRKKRRGESRAPSMAPGASAYDAYGPYDVDTLGLSRSPPKSSRPPPKPYEEDCFVDLPYDDAGPSSPALLAKAQEQMYSRPTEERKRGTEHGRRRERGKSHEQSDSRPKREAGARGRGRNRGRADRGQFSRGFSDSGRGGRDRHSGNDRPGHRPPSFGMDRQWPDTSLPGTDAQGFSPPIRRSLSPTSAAIARATNQIPVGVNYTPLAQPEFVSPVAPQGWSPYQNEFDMASYGYNQNYVQPHINPRFASAFGLGYMQAEAPTHYGSYEPPGNQQFAEVAPSSWGDEWTVKMSEAPATDRPDGHADPDYRRTGDWNNRN